MHLVVSELTYPASFRVLQLSARASGPARPVGMLKQVEALAGERRSSTDQDTVAAVEEIPLAMRRASRALWHTIWLADPVDETAGSTRSWPTTLRTTRGLRRKRFRTRVDRATMEECRASGRTGRGCLCDRPGRESAVWRRGPVGHERVCRTTLREGFIT